MKKKFGDGLGITDRLSYFFLGEPIKTHKKRSANINRSNQHIKKTLRTLPNWSNGYLYISTNPETLES